MSNPARTPGTGGEPGEKASAGRVAETGSSAYLDAASSEPLHPAAREALVAALGPGGADVRRLHGAARNARLLLDNAREVVAACLGLRPDEVTFTASGTDAVHTGLLGLLAGRARVSRRLVHSAVEHSAVSHAAAWHEERGGTTVVVPVDRTGRVDPEVAAEQLSGGPDKDTASNTAGDTAVLAVQAANHEVGTLQPLPELAQAAQAAGVPLFTDACALLGRRLLAPGWSVAAGSAHKWGGPAGVGLLLVRKGARWRNPFPADDRADPRSVGFENVAAALGAAAALQAVLTERKETDRRQRALVDRIRARVAAEVPDCEVVGDPVDRLAHLVTFSCLYVDGEALVTELDRRGFGVASGSACTASTLRPSHVLEAMGVLTHGNVRVSLARESTAVDVEAFLDVLPGVVADIRDRAGVR